MAMGRESPKLSAQSRASLEFETVLGFFGLACQTREGRALMAKRGLMPVAALIPHFQKLDRWFEFLSTSAALRLPAIPSAAELARNPYLDPFDAAELRMIRDVLAFWRRLWDDDRLRFASGDHRPDEPLLDLARRLAGLFQPDGSWRDDISPKYRQLITAFRASEGALQQTLAGLMKRYGDVLSEAVIFERNHRKVLAVKQDFKGRVHGIVQDYSASGHTAFIEPEEALKIQNRMIELQAEIQEELLRIRRELARAIHELPVIAEVICPTLAHLDMMQALALTGKATGSISTSPNQEGVLDLRLARHPLLDAAFARLRQEWFELEEADQNQMVALSLYLDQQTRGLVISGANTGGKTVTLKTVGLLAWMANSGLPVPLEEGSRVPFYDGIMADIGDHQSLSHNLSTYASHLANMKQVMETQGARILVLLDELGSGTDPQEGNALGQALIEALMDRGDHLIVTTHQQVLCTHALNHPHMENGSMFFDTRLLRPTYRFQQGLPGRSHALDIASNAGLPPALLARARQLIDDGQVDIQAAIIELQKRHKDLVKQKNKMRRDELRLHRRIQETRDEATKLKGLQDELKEKSKDRLKRTVENAERELRALLTETAALKSTRKSLAKFTEVKRAILNEGEPEPEALPPPELALSGLPPDQWRTGDRVYFRDWRIEGTIAAIERKKFRIDCNGKHVSVSPGDLFHLTRQAQAEVRVPRTMFDVSVAEDSLHFEVRLLGFRVEEALTELDQTIDRALRLQVPFLQIIHGHGSGALKGAVRDYLKTHQAKTMFRVQLIPENDGITEVHFND